MNFLYRILFITTVVGLADVFVVTLAAFGAGNDIVITEIGAYEESGHEWVEIYNRGSATIDFNGWKFFENSTNHGLTLKRGSDSTIQSGEYAVITQDDENFIADYPAVLTKIFDSSWGTLNESGEEIGLKNASGTMMEQFTYIAAPNYSLERKDVMSDDYTAANWIEHANRNSVGHANNAGIQGNDQGSDDNNQGTSNQQSVISNVFISEFVSNPSDNETEWVELVNENMTAVDMSGWTIEDGVGIVATLSNALSPGVFFVFDIAGSKLNNSGDVVKLKNVAGTIVHTVTFGDWDDGNAADNAPMPGKGESLARLGSGFAVTKTPTKGATNSFSTAAPAANQSAGQTQSGSGSGPSVAPRFAAATVVVNELVSDPADGAVEFVELFNRSGSLIDLSKWWLEDGSEKKTALTGIIGGNGYVVVVPINGNLNNSGDTVVLYAPDNTEIDRVSYGAWDDGMLWNNALRPDDPQSLAQ